MTLDAIAEDTLISLSRAQRETASRRPHWKQPEPSKALATMISLIAAAAIVEIQVNEETAK